MSSAKVAYPIGLRELEVVSTRMLGSGLLRVTLGGEGARGFESHVPEEHVRLIFPDEHGQLRLPERDGLSLRWPRPLPVSREYTVRRYDPAAELLDVDVALHPGGVASDWAVSVEPGTRIYVAGPPGGYVTPEVYARYLFAGDITALPAIARWLEMLPPDIVGWAFVEVADASEEIEMTVPACVQLRWVHRGAVPIGHGDALERALREVRLPAGERTFVWISGEAGVLKPLRRWVRDELGVPPTDRRITGYWKRGVADFDDED
ncbi:siderophore-interacting protein [Pseudonocardia acaciae]|uniref:siderophore-interacting protein n=1 Tax=Pseudonocardia acaciae TaxID=551276 RepID=UPI000685C020|nr:siderophore-interacting protein [Pseudonocardia acaciae]